MTHSGSSASEEEDTHALIEEFHMKERRGHGGRYADGEQEHDTTTTNEAASTALTEEERAELKRQKDLAERDDFVKRMNKRDKNRTKGGDKHDNEEEDGNGVDAVLADQERQLTEGGAIVNGSSRQVVAMSTLRVECR